MVRVKKYSWKKFSVDLKKGVEFLGSMKHEEALMKIEREFVSENGNISTYKKEC